MAEETKKSQEPQKEATENGQPKTGKSKKTETGKKEVKIIKNFAGGSARKAQKMAAKKFRLRPRKIKKVRETKTTFVFKKR